MRVILQYIEQDHPGQLTAIFGHILSPSVQRVGVAMLGFGSQCLHHPSRRHNSHGVHGNSNLTFFFPRVFELLNQDNSRKNNKDHRSMETEQ
jgi:hypothetical protein